MDRAPAAPTWPGLLTTLLGGHRPDLGRHRLGDGAGHARRGHPGAGRRLRGRAARQGRVARGGHRPGARDARARRPDRGRPARRSTPAAPAATGPTRSTSPRCRRWWSPAPAPGWSSTATARRRRPAARPTCSRSSAWSSTSSRPPPLDCLDRTGVTFCFAPQVPPRAAARGGPAPRARRPDDLQRARAAGEPGAALGAGGGLRRPAAGRRDGPGAGRPRRLGAGVPRRRRAGRAHADHDLAGLGGARRRGQHRAGRAGGRRPGPGGGRLAARRRPRPQRRGHPAVPGRRDRPGARRGAAQRGGGPGRAGARARVRWPSSCATGCGGRPSRSTAVRRRGRWPAGSRPAGPSAATDRRTGQQDPLDVDAPLARRVRCGSVQSI